MKLVIIGATGMVGGVALRRSLENPEVTKVTVIGRRSTGVEHEKLTEIQHSDYLDYSGLEDALSGQDGALFCLGAYTGTVPDDEFRTITVDYTLEFARALYARSPQAAFCLLSGQGADQSEKSSMAFARYKGIAENGLKEMGFSRVHLLRPGYIYPVEPRQEPNLMYRISRSLYPLLKFLMPNASITSEQLGWAMMDVALHGSRDFKTPELENKDMLQLAKAHMK
jgi:uncharacterized protein YbjT (DUF2867 family)